MALLYTVHPHHIFHFLSNHNGCVSCFNFFYSKDYDEPFALDPIDPYPEYCEGVKIFTWDDISRTVRETLLEPLFQALPADSKWWLQEETNGFWFKDRNWRKIKGEDAFGNYSLDLYILLQILYAQDRFWLFCWKTTPWERQF